jgi:hypothetical protein
MRKLNQMVEIGNMEIGNLESKSVIRNQNNKVSLLTCSACLQLQGRSRKGAAPGSGQRAAGAQLKKKPRAGPNRVA